MRKHKVAIAAGTFGVGLVLLWLIWRREQANAVLGTVSPGTSIPGGMFYPPTGAADPYAGTGTNVNFAGPGGAQRATTYIPLFGFIGTGRTWG